MTELIPTGKARPGHIGRALARATAWICARDAHAVLVAAPLGILLGLGLAVATEPIPAGRGPTGAAVALPPGQETAPVEPAPTLGAPAESATTAQSEPTPTPTVRRRVKPTPTPTIAPSPVPVATPTPTPDEIGDDELGDGERGDRNGRDKDCEGDPAHDEDDDTDPDEGPGDDPVLGPDCGVGPQQ